jgi:hypothetical protein
MSAMMNVRTPPGQNMAEISRKLDFQRKLQAVTNKIHATANVDEIMLEVSQELCDLFDADRITIYTVTEDRRSIVSKVKTGLASFKDLKLPITEQSVAGYVALLRQAANIRDVYDDEELRQLSSQLRFLKEVDKRTGYRTKQMLVTPILEAGGGELLGVVQVINTRDGQPFGPLAEEAAASLCETLAIALRQRQRPATTLRGKYDALVVNSIIAAEEMEIATRTAIPNNSAEVGFVNQTTEPVYKMLSIGATIPGSGLSDSLIAQYRDVIAADYAYVFLERNLRVGMAALDKDYTLQQTQRDRANLVRQRAQAMLLQLSQEKNLLYQKVGSFRAVSSHLEQLERQLRSSMPQHVMDMLGQQAAFQAR